MLRPHLFQEAEGEFELVFAGQAVGVKHVSEWVWLLSFMDYDPKFDDETPTTRSKILWPESATHVRNGPEIGSPHWTISATVIRDAPEL